MTAPRKLARAHFAFMRGMVQGADPAKLWNSYLFVHGRYDPRAATRRLQWIKHEFAQAARLQGRHGLARLIVFDSARLEPVVPTASVAPTANVAPPTGPVAVLLTVTSAVPIGGNPSAHPSFDVFCARHADFYTQKELRSVYESLHGPLDGAETDSARTDRHTRLIIRQLAALNWLEGLVAEAPQANHDSGADSEMRVLDLEVLGTRIAGGAFSTDGIALARLDRLTAALGWTISKVEEDGVMLNAGLRQALLRLETSEGGIRFMGDDIQDLRRKQLRPLRAREIPRDQIELR